MVKKRDYYEILGISRDASDEDIKKAYRKMAKKYHPDISKEHDSEKKFKEVQEAYEVLSDSNKKSNYDNFGHQNANGSDGFEGFGSNFGDFDDIFNNLFSKNSRNTKTSSDLDERIEMEIDFLEAVLGTKKTIQLVLEDYCQECNGSGAHNNKDIVTCQYCNGLGYVNVEQRIFFGNVRSQQMCSYCDGQGQKIKNKCFFCKGKKTQKYKKTLVVDIPAGIDNGMTLKMSQKGNGGRIGSNNLRGDLYITFRVKASKIFSRKGLDVYTEIFITFSQAVLGVVAATETIYGKVDLKIPAGTQSGNKMRLKNKGIADVNSYYRKGDHYVIVNIETPKNISKEQKKIFEDLKKLENNYYKNKTSSGFFKKIL
ncbi:Chaperone protein [Candidatus Phytoplasma mali]|uniref:Chaperone protein DnaJ n=1 Tax=Phytoplasma mali (strain AT) TaxID=482235 RepID=B3QZK7_PHYMT|nr:molecular chaperone DnaJ [Candidatus Phytoplasma mali]CAP18394.1 Chaperone protein [Candidatus Phytoplasma mali]